MYFFKDKKLAEDLKVNIVSEKDQMIYLFFSFVTFNLLACKTYNFYAYEGTSLTIYDYAVDLIIMATTIISILISFSINQKGDAQNFVSRYVSLSFPIAIKAILMGIILGVAAVHFDNLEIPLDDLETPLVTGKYTAVSMLILCVYILHRYIVCFKIAAGKNYNV